MHRYLRTIVAALALLLLVAGAALAAPGKNVEHQSDEAASHQPSSEAPESEAPESEAPEVKDQADQADTPDAADGADPSSQLLDRIVLNLGDAGIVTDADTVKALAADYGVGGAVRILAWADAAGVDPSEITDLFDAGMGWGQIAKQLNAADDTLNLSPGIGHVMSGGHGNGGEHGNSANAPGHNK